MSKRFHKKRGKSDEQEIPVTAMPDIIFMLLIFFMVTTVLRETEVQVRTLLPSAEALSTIEQRRYVAHIWIGPQILGGGEYGETRVQIEDQLMDPEDFSVIRHIMYERHEAEPRLIVSLEVDQESEMGIVTDVQEELREAGALRINYASREEQE